MMMEMVSGRRWFILAILFHLAWSSPLSNGPWGPTDPVADPAAIILVPSVRVTVLTDRVLRIERIAKKAEDRKTVAVINRKLPVPHFEHSINNNNNNNNGNLLTVQTKCITLTYRVGTEFSAETLQVKGNMYCHSASSPDNNSSSSWTYLYGQHDPHNLLGTIRTLDGENAATLNCSLRDPVVDHCEWGLISRSGYAIVNDTHNFCLSDQEDWWDGRNRDDEDFYIFGHGHDYQAALQDYRLLGGAIPLLPRYALGVWYSRWFDYTAASAAEMVRQFEWRAIPLDVFVLDMNWHTKNNWTGYSWDKRMYGNHPEDAVSYMKARNLAVTLNLHDAAGVYPFEDKYSEMCRATGCQEGYPVPFSVVNQTIAYALEDQVMQPLEKISGIDFWWIDWQQGEKGPGGAAGGKQNPTIWTAHIKSTNANRRRQQQNQQQDETVRNMVLARWGGLGGHRYPVHFSGDVDTVNWENLEYQAYFSMTATNVGAIWSHDIEGPELNPELYTRWLQFGVVSGIMRSHDRGMSAGGCAANDPPSCTIVVPWEVAPKYASANLKALRLRGSLIPYLYSAAYKAHVTGKWFITPMYYEWPELDSAYETAAPRPNNQTRFDPQYMFGDDMWVAPVVKPGNHTDGIARLSLWVPPGTWVGVDGGKVLRGDEDGSSSVDVLADLDEIPMFARAGSVIPTIPVRPGATIGLAMKQFNEIIWTVYLASDAPVSGSGMFYEDDGISTAYHERDSFTITTASYNITTSDVLAKPVGDATARKMTTLTNTSGHNLDPIKSTTMTFTVTTSGHCEKVGTSRATTLRLVNTLPPTSVDVNGQSIPYARFGGEGTWTFDSTNAAVVIELPPSKISEGLQVTINTTGRKLREKAASLDGLGFRLQRAIAAENTLDILRISPGCQTGRNKDPGYLVRSASAGSALDYLAGLPDHDEFDNLLASIQSLLSAAHQELLIMKVVQKKDLPWVARAQTLIGSAH
ncbi:Neutral alpha-glucosidase C [Seminavis robusta]|uniref:Neutral alpha-glucosidase C n=1 Tax=Seminavis robusta TaxID=568900 RepID=A0A9N8DBN7_9STRA|nr:Neutral alpha-glucosidase C [Seminavis robusta]|eukprot:Sro71_g039410.1 Neutral alpha-glucosidase C (973) ;mRNA; f:73623-76648